MAVQQLAPLILSNDEHAELRSLMMRQKGAGSENPDRADLCGGWSEH